MCSGLVVQVVSALLRGNWQDFNWHDASRGPSAIAELLVIETCYCFIHMCCQRAQHIVRGSPVSGRTTWCCRYLKWRSDGYWLWPSVYWTKSREVCYHTKYLRPRCRCILAACDLCGLVNASKAIRPNYTPTLIIDKADTICVTLLFWIDTHFRFFSASTILCVFQQSHG